MLATAAGAPVICLGMRYSRLALLLFGAGGLLGLAVVSADLSGLGRVASLAMAVGIALLPVALVADWWSHRPWRNPKPRPDGNNKSPKPGARRQSSQKAKSSPPRKRGSKSK